MASLISSFSLSILKLKLVLILFLIRTRRTTSQKHEKVLFIFGDSFYDPGNNNYINTTTLEQANFSPYGETFFNYPTGRFSDGRLISDFIAEYAKLPLLPPFLQRPHRRQYYYEYSHGVNFASAGAGALVDTFSGSLVKDLFFEFSGIKLDGSDLVGGEIYHVKGIFHFYIFVINLRTQLSYFGKLKRLLEHKLGNDEAKMRLSRGIYMFSIGTNDYLSLFLTNSTILNTFSNQQYVDMVIGNFTTAIHEVYRRGGRKFGFMNLGSLGCMPGLRALQNGNNNIGTECLEKASTLAKLHNEALSKKLSLLSHQFKGFKYSLYDFNTTLTQLINHPATYGFKESKTACCGIGKFRGIFSCGGKRPPTKNFEVCDNPNEYVFWDSYHLTQKAYNIMAYQMWAGSPSIIGHLNLSHL